MLHSLLTRYSFHVREEGRGGREGQRGARMEGKERKWKENEREEGNPAFPSFPRATQHLPTVTEKEYSWRSLKIMRQTSFRTLAIRVGTRVMGFYKGYDSTPDAMWASGGHSQGARRGHRWDIPETEPQGLEGLRLNPPTSGGWGWETGSDVEAGAFL